MLPVADGALRVAGVPDWLTCSVRPSDEDGDARLRRDEQLSGLIAWVEARSPVPLVLTDWEPAVRHWRARRRLLSEAGVVYLTEYFGLASVPSMVGLEATGDRAPYLWEALADMEDFDYRITRADVRYDVEGGASMRADMERCAQSIADRHRVTVRRVLTTRAGDEVGRTMYLGAPSSDVIVRIYDKYLESGEERYLGVTRLEVQRRYPNSANPVRVSMFGHPADLVGGSRWAQDLLGEVVGQRVDVVPVERGEVTPLVRSLQVLGQQWGGKILAMCGVLGGGDVDLGWLMFRAEMEAHARHARRGAVRRQLAYRRRSIAG